MLQLSCISYQNTTLQGVIFFLFHVYQECIRNLAYIKLIFKAETEFL